MLALLLSRPNVPLPIARKIDPPLRSHRQSSHPADLLAVTDAAVILTPRLPERTGVGSVAAPHPAVVRRQGTLLFCDTTLEPDVHASGKFR